MHFLIDISRPSKHTAMLVKIYGEIDSEGQRRYSPATCIGCEVKSAKGFDDQPVQVDIRGGESSVLNLEFSG